MSCHLLKIGERETALPMGKRPKKSRLTRKTSGKMSLLCKNQQRKKSTRKNAGRIIPLRLRKKQSRRGSPPAVLCGSDALKNLNRSCYEDYQY